MTRSAASPTETRNANRLWCPRAQRLPLLLAIILSVVGCTNFFYNRLDTLAAWYIQDLVSLDASQSSDLRSWLESTLQWHRRSELVRYASFLRDLAGKAAQPGNAAMYQDIETQVEAFGSRLVKQASPEAARLLVSLTPAQLTELEASLADKSRERSEASLKALASGKWRQKRAKDIEKQLKRWTGSITKEQQQLIAEQSTRFESTTEDWLESQARWRKAIFGALQARFISGQSSAAVEERILALLRAPETQWTHAYQEKAKRNREQSLAVLSAIDVSLTGAQRSYLQRELTELAQQLEGMIDPSSTPPVSAAVE